MTWKISMERTAKKESLSNMGIKEKSEKNPVTLQD